ncbi:protein mono-ADP-ribosyltransferase PARP14 [Manacus candei]|uniref:protein mono-ADP-ribosyltransferase PARP14 n=1 Tax=Manacus candei TaxID=415023 RepID=UPI00222784E2|nr:protein mono-ADP-ribosyltransferase PARP14 [Manacus candei]
MAGQRPGAFPLLVRGDWGSAEPPPALKKKLLCYFQSQKRSGGGECELRAGTDAETGTGHLLVCFARPEVRQRVLDRRVHELEWGPGGRLSLQVTALPAGGDSAQEEGRAGGDEVPVNEPQVSLPIYQSKETPVCTLQEKAESCEKLEEEKATSRKSVIVVTTASGEEIEDEILEMYFENKKKSGGGIIRSYVKEGQRMIITFEDEQDAQEVLQRKHHKVKKIDLFVKPWQVDTLQEPCQAENSEGSLPSTSVVLENMKETVKDCMVIMLVENVSGLSEDDGDFSVEMIPELRAAVVTFNANTDTGEFAKKVNQNHRAKQQNITARCLELTKSIRAENIPPNTSSDYITIYFENKRNGGAQVTDVQQLPDEDAAIITFSDHKDVTNILAKKHTINKTPISVYPYYTSLGTALYGKEGPQIKKPDPITLPLDPYIWNYLQKNSSLIAAINCEMAKCNCVPAWPEPHCADPKVSLHPSAVLSERKRSVSQLVKTWKENVSAAFSQSISKYEAIQCQVSAEVWEAIRNSFPCDEVLMIPRISKDLLVLVGEKEVVSNVEEELKVLIEKAIREIEREKQRTEQVVTVSPGEYGILQVSGLEEKFRMEFPGLKITYDYLQKIIRLCGVPEEVYKVKGEIFDTMHKMVKKTVNIHPYIFQFLEHIDNETLSQSLFMSKQINAFYELGTGAVILNGSTPEDLLKAEEEIKKELDYRSIALEDESVLQDKEWQMLTKENCSSEAVTVTQAGSQVVIAGCSQAVAKAFEELSSFIDANTQVQRVIGGKPMAVMMFFEKEKVDVWGGLLKKGVKVDFSTQKKYRVISLSGSRPKVLEGVSLVEQILSGLYYKRVVIGAPGAKSYFKEHERVLASHAKQEFKCLVRLEEHSEEHLEEQQEHSNEGKPYMQVTMGEIVIAVYRADLCTHSVDVVVNASNEDLKHIGGLADALLRAAGPALQEECDELVRKNGHFHPGSAVITGAGKLPCKNVIHAVGPRWRKEEPERCVDLLRKTVKKSLELAETYNCSSIALPAISGGIFGFPLELCTYSIVSSIKETLEGSKGDSSLKEVHLVDIVQDNIQAFSKALREVFPDSSPSYRSLHQTSKIPQPRERKISQKSKNLPCITTEEGLDIVLQTGSIEDATTSIVVISVGKDLQLDKGPLAKALLSKAGPMLQTDLRKEGLGRAEEGAVLKTNGYNLDCSVVLHAIVPAWFQRKTSSKVFGDIITKCLEIAEELSLKSITFPAIGTGNLGFPTFIVAKLLFDKVFEFSSKNGVNSLEEVHFLLQPKDTAHIQIFLEELEKRCGNTAGVEMQKPSPNEAGQGTAFSTTSSTSAHNLLEMTIGSIVFQVAEGDITKEKGDVIVNITNQTFNLQTGVSRAILNGAGKAVEVECCLLAQKPHKSYIITQAGNLPCKKIIHFVAQDDIKFLVFQVLQECELQGYTSVAFPAIGTGEAGRNPAEVADKMIDAVTDFARRNSPASVKTIKVVIFQPHLLSVFHASMQKRERPTKTPVKSFISKIKSFRSPEKRSPKEKSTEVLEKKIDLAVVQICGEIKKEVEEAENWLRSAISKEQLQTEIVDDSISHFSKEENEELHHLQKKLKIALYLKGTSIGISGFGKDVWIAHSAIQKMILRVKATKQEEVQAGLLQNLIEWQYFEEDSYVPFDSLTNMQLENAYRGKQKSISVTIGDKKYTVDMKLKYAVDDQGKQTAIRRVDKSEDQESTVLPATWDNMENERLKIVELRPETREYRDVQERFLQTCQSFRIEKIERVQNPYFWKAYQIKKREMDKKNGNTNNERLLFHGTSKESLTLINNRGFDRSYAGMHAANFGNGTYFAVNANYSAHDNYSKPDTNGKKHMYLARVLVGEYSQGRKGAITPEPKNASNSIDLFDSSTDDVSRPSMFVIFNDIQAYPEYLITFTMCQEPEEMAPGASLQLVGHWYQSDHSLQKTVLHQFSVSHCHKKLQRTPRSRPGAGVPRQTAAEPREAGACREKARPPLWEAKAKAAGSGAVGAAMAGQRPGTFPLLVRGDWGSAEPPPALKKKLLCYFQSQKRSGGGECELRAGTDAETGTGTGHLLVCFARPEVKQRVLQRQPHELHLEGKGKVKLTVTEPETTRATEEETLEEKLAPTEALDAMSNLQTKESFVPSSELQEEAGSAETSPSVVFENIQKCSPNCLRLLLENISGLTVDEDFTVEVIPEINVAVATFIQSLDTEEFVKTCLQHKRVREFKMTARVLELTRTIKAENLPDSISPDYITVYFESARNGGGPVSDVQHFPEENSAIITFCDRKDVNTVLEKQHLLEQTLISVHPYYHSLGTALYGGERPTIKMPDPVGVPLDPYVWQFLQRHNKLIQGINQEMAVCHCELKWPQADCANPKVTLCPSSSLSEQNKAMIKLIKTWKQDASEEFSRIMARYTAIKCKVKSADWGDVKTRLLEDVSLIITDISEDVVAIAGSRAAVESAEKEVRECMEKAMKQSEREKQSIEISVPVVPGKYAVLHNAGLEESIHKEYPCLRIFYDDKKKAVQLCGLPAEVYKIKADLLEKVLSMPYTSVSIDPHVFHYLQGLDNKKMSDTLFLQKKINTFYELEEDTVLLYGDSPTDLLEAEKQIKTSLESKCINVEDGEVMKKEQWKKLLVSLHKTYSSSQETVITEQSVGKENKVIIAGFSKAVTEVYQKLNDFIDKNTLVEKIIPARSVVVEFIEKEKSGAYCELRKKGVTVRFDIKTPCISLRGPRAEVPEAVNMFEKLVSSLYSKNVPIDKPGAKEFFIERQDSCVFEAKQKFRCFIRIKEEEEKQQQQWKGEKVKRKLYYETRLPHGIVVAVYKGDLSDYPVDVVVNASNEDLQLLGGISGALLRAAGPALQEECDERVRMIGRFQPGSAVLTGAGKLPCKNVIHAVGPRWRKEEPEKCIWLLKKAVKKSLELAETYNCSSIALPAISGGIFGFPLQTCADSIASAIKETLEGSMGDSSLKEVHLVDNAEETVQVLSETVKEMFSGKSSSPTPHVESCKMRKRQKKTKEGVKMVTTKEGLCVHVEEKNTQEATTDVVVNSVGPDLQFGVGPLCKALLERAGPALQVDFDKEKQSQASGPGSVVCTSGHALACKSVFHAILPGWNGAETEKVLEDVINLCLKKAEELELKSISFPAIGTGGFGFPKTIVSKLMFDVVFEFSSSHTPKNLQEVHFLLHPKDVDNIQAFTTELEHRVAASCNAAAPQPSFIKPVSTEVLGVHEMRIGSITLQAISGDITKEDTEVIVNISNQSFDAKTGVSKAIMDAAGSQVVDECAQYAGQHQSGFITTQGGNLLCSKIIHLLSSNHVKSQVSKVLNECEQRMYKSVAFPAIGTGQAGQSPAKVADEMLDAIVEFASKKSVQHLQTIKIVIFQTNMLKDFYESMKKREDLESSTADSWFSVLKSLIWGKKQSTEKKKPVILEKKVNLVTFQICGESQENVDAAESWIKDLILKEQSETTFTNELIESFGEREIAALVDLQRRKHVTIQLDSKLSPPVITISGISRDVWFVLVEIQTMVQKMKDVEEEQSKAELLSNLVEWRYLGSNDTFVAFDKRTNMQLEDAKLAKKPYLNVKINKKNYKVDLNTLQAHDDQGKTINIQRVSKNEELPKEWEDLQNERVKLVNLKPSHPDYGTVEKMFRTTCANFTIEKIERVQNPFLWQTYQIKKKSICKKNKRENNEKLLFHGTAASSLSTINHCGFNRGFAGKNAAAIGNGTYFAAHASYSAQNQYSVPDVNGKKHMYLARVLTGEYCAGKAGLITPPPKNPADPTDLYDSVVDNVSNPTVFVIFNDIQAYPEYLITFK